MTVQEDTHTYPPVILSTDIERLLSVLDMNGWRVEREPGPVPWRVQGWTPTLWLRYRWGRVLGWIDGWNR